jgi:hypothetical protein
MLLAASNRCRSRIFLLISYSGKGSSKHIKEKMEESLAEKSYEIKLR